MRLEHQRGPSSLVPRCPVDLDRAADSHARCATVGGPRLPAVTTPTVRPATVMLAAGADVLAVLVFAAVGRSSHAEMVDAFEVLTTASPFLIGLVIGWLVGRAWRAWRAPLRLPVGTAVWAGATVV